MKVFRSLDVNSTENPNPGKLYRQEILTGADMAQNLGGIFGILPQGMVG